MIQVLLYIDSGRDGTCIILAPHVTGACGVGACVMVPIRLLVMGGGHIELDIYIWYYVNY